MQNRTIILVRFAFDVLKFRQPFNSCGTFWLMVTHNVLMSTPNQKEKKEEKLHRKRNGNIREWSSIYNSIKKIPNKNEEIWSRNRESSFVY